MGENLQTMKYSDEVSVPFAQGYWPLMYPDSSDNIATFGRLYDWASASRNQQPDADGHIQGVCPDGWALPTLSDYECLLSLGSDALRHNDPAFWLDDNTATNSSGFGAMPAGYYEGNSTLFMRLYGEGYIWVGEPTINHVGQACSFLFGCPETRIVNVPAGNGLSVRCVSVE